MRINDKTNLIGVFTGTIDDLLRPFENSNQLLRAKWLAPIYIKFGKKFNIRADLAFAQMCHETGLLQFTGIAKPDWNNFCGLGITGPGTVQKFLTEDFGVVAHYAHLAWYVYPDHINSMCSKKFDPRHFGDTHYKYNGDTTLKRLAGSWAVPGTTYAEKIAYYANIINGNITINYGNCKTEPVSPIVETPKKSESNVTKYDIIVQCGHVGIKKGSTGTPGEREWTEKLGKAMEPLLKETGLKYRIMGGLNWLPKLPNKAKIFLSLHADGSTNSKAHGFTMGYKPESNQRFKDALALSYKEFSNLIQRSDNCTNGLKLYYMWTTKKENPKSKYTIQRIESDFYCLLEHGFFTNSIERKWLEENIEAIAKHHVEVIERFLKDV